MCENRRSGPDNAWGDVMHCFCPQCEGGEVGWLCVGCIEGIGWIDYLMFDLSPY